MKIATALGAPAVVGVVLFSSASSLTTSFPNCKRPHIFSTQHVCDVGLHMAPGSYSNEYTSTRSGTVASLPQRSDRGIYQIQSEVQYTNFIRANPDKLVVIKFFASYCRACRALEPRYVEVKNDEKLEGLPIVFGEFQSSRSTRDLFQKLSVLTLPTIHFYDGARNGALVENFPCGVSRIPLFKKKLARFINTRVDPETLALTQVDATEPIEEELMTPKATRSIMDNEDDLITMEHINFLRHGLPFFRELTDMEFEELLSKARLLTFDQGDLIIKQGKPGTTFYVLKSGTAEMSVRSRYDDPISTPPDYLGAVVNELKTFDYFGERALTTGEPYAATVRVLDDKVRAFAFDADMIPESSILSKKRRATQELVEQLSMRYRLPDDYVPNYPVTPRDECILELLVRFRQIRQAAKCFEYVMQSQPEWGSSPEIARRSILVGKLSKTQLQEFETVFRMVDSNNRGKISLMDMRKFMESARIEKSNEELFDYDIGLEEFMGVMAEAEFYNLFTETFQELDRENSGYVRAGDLDEILGSVRVLVSDDPSSIIIDVEDKDVMVDYEQFSKMLLGAAL